MYSAPVIIMYYDQQMHNYLTNYHTPTLRFQRLEELA